jgi:hypothetical protein
MQPLKLRTATAKAAMGECNNANLDSDETRIILSPLRSPDENEGTIRISDVTSAQRRAGSG